MRQTIAPIPAQVVATVRVDDIGDYLKKNKLTIIGFSWPEGGKPVLMVAEKLEGVETAPLKPGTLQRAPTGDLHVKTYPN
jgi:hypothetical protein